jgi:D-serine deaminase-like pyridoxal phosphate-dependent protein
MMPTAVLLRSALKNNSASFADYCMRHHVSFAPHGKTTMSPRLFRIQLDDGAWAITAANSFQAKTMIEHGVPRVFIANEVIAPGDIAWLASATHRGHEIYCCVDSIEAVDLLDAGLAKLPSNTQVPVLVELGVPNGRTGCRSVTDALNVARHTQSSRRLRLVGVSGFEGIISANESQTAEQLVDSFLFDLRRTADEIIAQRMVDVTGELVISAGGSVFFERVVAQLYRPSPAMKERVVIRSGCYISHDDGVIHELSPLGAAPRDSGDVFQPALEVWGVVLSRPEPTRVVVGVGKRDVSTDGLLPVAKKRRRRNSDCVESWTSLGRAVRVDDQHTYLDIAAADDIAVGDLIGLGISHPCTTFDKWRAIPIVDDEYRVVEVARTFF